MKIALVCSHGGHLTEILYLMDAFQGHEVFFVTYDSPRTRTLKHKKYLLKNIGTNPIRLLMSFAKFLVIFMIEKPKLVVSTGSEIAIPAFILAKFVGIRTIFIESWCRVRTKSWTGRTLYFVADLFLVQWPELAKIYGKKALYRGSVI